MANKLLPPKARVFFGVRLDPNKLRTARELGINLADKFRDALDGEISRRKKAKCPTCGRAPK